MMRGGPKSGSTNRIANATRRKGPLRANRSAVTEEIILGAIRDVNSRQISRFWFGLPL
jgi:hypothetical protein